MIAHLWEKFQISRLIEAPIFGQRLGKNYVGILNNLPNSSPQCEHFFFPLTLNIFSCWFDEFE